MDQRRRIAYLVSLFPVVRETFIAREIIELERNGFDVTVVSLRSNGQRVGTQETPRATVVYIPYFWSAAVWSAAITEFLSRPLRTTRAIASIIVRLIAAPSDAAKFLAIVPKSLCLARRLRRNNIHHIHSHWATVPATCALFLHRAAGIRFSMSAHAWDIFAHGTERLLAEKILAADRVFVCTRHGKKRLAEFGGDDDKVHLVYHGIDLRRYAFVSKKPGGKLVIAAGGSLTPQKGLDVLLRAVAHAGSALSGCRIVIFGDGPERNKLMRLAERVGSACEVDFTGTLEHERVIALMQTAEIFVMPSREAPGGFIDGLPNVLVEAMACGASVVATRFSAIPELIEHVVDGLLVDAEDAGQLAEALVALVSDSEQRGRLSAHARQTVEKMFDINRNIQPMLQYFETTTGAAATAARP